MRTDLTDITLVVDRSGSMQSVKEDAEGGINSFLESQAKETGDALVTLVQFDDVHEFVLRGVPVEEAGQYRLQPRGMTALLDAVGRAITDTGRRLAAMPENERPGLVVFAVMTDGLENASREFTKSQIKEMIEHQKTVYNWQFSFLGANQDAFADAGEIGIDRACTATYSAGKERAAWGGMTGKVGRMRQARAAQQTVVNEFTATERGDMQ